ncbi:hypothetical protein QI30_04330 [Kurthia sp. 3B1D]|uniref:Uncharacterized protein n=1 Tax=Candidatus Kurthia intestinigallinarum TaxID=1562256 RepID=A0A433RWY0_9BACL|nr:hypothetical protein QI30_04330 [Kurthia sp. 3B1D]
MLINIIGISSILILLVMIILNMSLSKIITVLFVSSIFLFIVRLFIEGSKLSSAFTESFGILSIVGFICVVIHFLKKKTSTN